MDMSGHNNERVHVNLATVLKQTVIKNQSSSLFREYEIIASAEIDEI